MSEKVSESINSINTLQNIEEHTISEEKITIEQAAKLERRENTYNLNRANKELSNEEARLADLNEEYDSNYQGQESFFKLGDEVYHLEKDAEAYGLLHYIEANAVATAKGDNKEEDNNERVNSTLKIDEILNKYTYESDEQKEEVERLVEIQIEKQTEFYANKSKEELDKVELSPEGQSFRENEYMTALKGRWSEISTEKEISSEKIEQLKEAIQETEAKRADNLRREKGEAPLDPAELVGKNDPEKSHVNDMDTIKLTSALAEGFYNNDRTRVEDIENELKARLEAKYPGDTAKQEELYNRYYKLAENNLDEITTARDNNEQKTESEELIDLVELSKSFSERLKGLTPLSIEYQQEAMKIRQEIDSMDVDDDAKKSIRESIWLTSQSGEKSEKSNEEGTEDEPVEDNPEKAKEELLASYSERLKGLTPLSIEYQQEAMKIRQEINSMDVDDDAKKSIRESIWATDASEGSSEEGEYDSVDRTYESWKSQYESKVAKGEVKNVREGLQRAIITVPNISADERQYLLDRLNKEFPYDPNDSAEKAARKAAEEKDTYKGEVEAKKEESRKRIRKIKNLFSRKERAKKDGAALNTGGAGSADSKRTKGLIGSLFEAFQGWLASKT